MDALSGARPESLEAPCGRDQHCSIRRSRAAGAADAARERRSRDRVALCGHCVRQGEVVESKRLSATMDVVKERQRQRAEAKITKPATTRRDARLRAGTPRRTATGAALETPL